MAVGKRVMTSTHHCNSKQSSSTAHVLLLLLIDFLREDFWYKGFLPPLSSRKWKLYCVPSLPMSTPSPFQKASQKGFFLTSSEQVARKRSAPQFHVAMQRAPEELRGHSRDCPSTLQWDIVPQSPSSGAPGWIPFSSSTCQCHFWLETTETRLIK